MACFNSIDTPFWQPVKVFSFIDKASPKPYIYKKVFSYTTSMAGPAALTTFETS